MRILLLSPYPEGLLPAFAASGDSVMTWNERIAPALLQEHGIEFIVVFGYRYIIRQEILDLLPGKVINLHISLLPWNKGADPNLWSWLDGTPKGVTIHEVDQGVDTGPILVQREIRFGDGETLAGSYTRLRGEIEALFCESWPQLRTGTIQPRPQTEPGTLHRAAEKGDLIARLPLGWDTPVADVVRVWRQGKPGFLR